MAYQGNFNKGNNYGSKPKLPPFEFKTFNEITKDEDLVSEALNVANQIVDDKQGTTKTHIRRFYQEYVSIMSNKTDFDPSKKDLLRIKMLIPKAEYSFAKNDKGKNFIIWFRNNILKIENFEDAEKFMFYFEAFLGFFYSKIKGELK